MTAMPRTVLRKLTGPTTRRLPLALLTGIAVEIGLRVLRLPTLVRVLGISLRTGPGQPGRHADPAGLGARDSSRYLAARHVIRLWPERGANSCLRLALIAGHLLRHRRPTLHLGVAQVDGQTRAHAWISVDSMVFDPLAGIYRPLIEPAG